MQFFFDPVAAQPPGLTWTMTLSYFEVVHSTPPAGTYTLYVSGSAQPDAVVVTACLGDELTTWIRLVEGPQFGAVWRRVIGHAYPTVGRMFEADPSSTSMGPGYDPDDQRRKWFVRLQVDELDLPAVVDQSNAAEFLTGERLMAAYEIVRYGALTTLNEIAHIGMSTVDKNAPHRREFGVGVERAQRWAPAVQRALGLHTGSGPAGAIPAGPD
jgi:hypothetical protein